MNFAVKSLPKSLVEITVEAPYEEVEEYFPKAARDFSMDLDIPGFRKGNAPLSEVRKYVSEFSLLEKAASYAVEEFLWKAVKAEDLAVAGPPSVEIAKLAVKNPLVFKARVAVMPHIKLPDWKKISRDIRAKKTEPAVLESEAEEALRYLRDSRRTFLDVARAAQKGDRVEVSFEAFENGVPVEGAASKNHPIVLGEGKFLPGFEDGLLGLKSGEAKEFSIAVPLNWPHEKLAGKTLSFRILMEKVREVHDVPMDDSFAKSIGSFETLEDLKRNIREGILEEKKLKEKERTKEKILDEIRARSKFELPEVVVERETERLVQRLQATVKDLTMSFEDYLSRARKTEKEVRDELRDEAEKRIAAGFILRTIAKEESVGVSDEEVAERAARELSQFSLAKEAEKKVDPVQFREYVRNVLISEKTLQLLETC